MLCTGRHQFVISKHDLIFVYTEPHAFCMFMQPFGKMP